MQPNQHEQKVFQSLARSTEGDIIANYIARVRDELRDTIIDNPTSTLEDLAGARQTRKVLKELQDRLIARDTISSTPDRFS